MKTKIKPTQKMPPSDSLIGKRTPTHNVSPALDIQRSPAVFFSSNHAPHRAARLMRKSDSDSPRRARIMNDMQQTTGTTRISRMFGEAIQPKLTLNTPGDVYEQEAEHVSNHVMRMSDHASDKWPACGQKATDDMVHRQPESSEQPGINPEVESQIHQMRGSGQPLPPSVRRSFEPRFGEDFSKVRVHTGPDASYVARQLNARAFTIGRDVMFAAGQYAPETAEGEKLLAHELTHVVQQGGGERTKISREPAGDVVQRPAGPEQTLQDKYKITIESGNKNWSKDDLGYLESALARLSKKEAAVLEGYRFIRWTTKEDRADVDKTYKDPGKEECGFHEPGADNKTFKISMYDKCFGGPSDTKYDVPNAVFEILHEIGHAVQWAEQRQAWDLYKQAEVDHNKAVASHKEAADSYNDATPADQRKLKANLDKLEAKANKLDLAFRAAENQYEAAKKRNLNEFSKLVAGKADLMDYSQPNAFEALPDAFAAYHANPRRLQEANPELYKWFAKHGELGATAK
jgi:hypothetical protein